LLGDQLAFKLGQRGEDPEHELPRWRGRVDRGALPREHLESDSAYGEVVDGVDEMVEVAAEPIELPHDQRPAIPERLQAGGGKDSMTRLSFQKCLFAGKKS
jgi:hypothetical protein